jgi:hypothetical protein
MWPTTSLNCRQASPSELGAHPRIDPAGQKELALPECHESLDSRCGARCCSVHENGLLPPYLHSRAVGESFFPNAMNASRSRG